MGANVQPQGVNIQVRGGFIFPLFVTLSLSLFFSLLTHPPHFFSAPLSSPLSKSKTQPILNSVMPAGVSFLFLALWREGQRSRECGKMTTKLSVPVFSLTKKKQLEEKKKTGKLPAAGRGRRARRPHAHEHWRPQQPDIGLGLRARGGARRDVREREIGREEEKRKERR